MSELDPDHHYRLSDSERDEALEHLRTALQDGRLDLDEHERRSSETLRAVTNTDLVPLFDDLPRVLRPSAIEGSRETSKAPATRAKGDVAKAEKGADVEAEKKKDGPNVNGLVIWGGIIFVIWGIPAIAYGGTGSLIGWLIFLALFMVPAVTIATVQGVRKRADGRPEIEE
ncbi:DUF1707 domain-containing protein [Nocardiopsis sp. JB363]|uniref:DUF1707 SHOCT-like domain-containing protein n=1 Tax=Nocardiopsis sp. JB363 TaxID=1434837 RepID=UPI00097B6D72|nr:DUF1707 domain-containing protein [Nocardiopsis sp. JB363]SIO84286.1 hypothetical protein BQ8420_01120 [Nocardiopsis sp. JB363]